MNSSSVVYGWIFTVARVVVETGSVLSDVHVENDLEGPRYRSCLA